tara:strand:+ start:2004 stop:3545 length:1542 start_codon:yes stop_codon:yes gene_type:complete
MSIEQRFMAAFEGSTAAHGQTEIGSTRRNGKTEAKSFVVRSPLTNDLVKHHLSGKTGVGAIPINDKNNCKFAAIDIDTYPVDHGYLVRKLKSFEIPMAVCRSKSGGAHLYMFFQEFFPASEVRETLIEIAATIGYSGSEIFPKQDQILADRGDVGNFINLPYFDAENTLRYMVDDKGQDISLIDFLDWVDNNRLSMTDMYDLSTGTSAELFDDAPPCVQTMLTNGFPEGTRNKGMFQTAIYLKKKFPDGWQQEMEAVNQQHFNPPLPSIELVQIQQQHTKKDYGWLCSEEPFCSHCNKQMCKTRKHGMARGNGSGSVDMPSISGLTILLSEPRLYFLDVNGKRLELHTKQLQIPMQFQEACMEQINFMPPTLKTSEWQQIVNNLLMNASQIEVPEELTIKGQFKEFLQSFCTSRIRAMSPEELDLGKPWTEDGKTYFKIKGLQEFLVNRGFTKLSRPQIQQKIQDLNEGKESHTVFRFKDDGGKWHSARVWWVPEFVDQEIELPEGKVYEAPF